MITIRRIDPAEWPVFRDVRLRALQDSPDAFGSTFAAESAWPDGKWVERLELAATSGADAPLFAVSEAGICGLAWVKVFPAEPGVAHLFQMWVAPESRRQGAGAHLLQAALDWARQVGVDRMRLGVTLAGDSPALRLYARHGFVPVGGPQPLREGSALVSQTMERVISTVAD